MNLLASLLSRLGGSSARRQLAALYRTQAVIEFDTQGTVLSANAAFLSLMHYTLDQVRGQHHRLFVDPAEHQGAGYAAFWDQLRRGEPFVGRCRRIAGDGQEVWLQANYCPVVDARGHVVKVVKYAMDISAEVKRDAEANSQLARWAERRR